MNLGNLDMAQAMQVRIATTSSGHNAALMACSQRWLEAIKMLKELRGPGKGLEVELTSLFSLLRGGFGKSISGFDLWSP